MPPLSPSRSVGSFIGQSTLSLAKHNNSGSFSPGRDTASLSARQAAGGSRGHASWMSEHPLPMPQGPPHIGKRDELVQANKTMHRDLQVAAFEVRDKQSVNAAHTHTQILSLKRVSSLLAARARAAAHR